MNTAWMFHLTNKNIYYKQMKDKLIVTGHIAALIIIYLLSFVLPGIITDAIFNFPEQIDYLRIIVGVIFAISIFLYGSKLYVEKIMKLKLSDLRVKFKWPDPFWVIVSVLVPFSIVMFYYSTGKAEAIIDQSDLYSTRRFFIHLIFVSGLTAGIVEEVFFRGILMGFLEKKYGLVYAIIIPSLLFGAPHLINIDTFSIQIIIQVTVFITFYGMVVSLLIYYTNNIWNNISLHISWNIITGIIIKQGEFIDSNFVLQLKSKSLFWDGGDYGVDVSFVGLTGIIIVGILVLIRKKGIVFKSISA